MISGEKFQSLTEISFYTELNCIINDQNKHLEQNIYKIQDFEKELISNFKNIFVYTHFIHDFMNKFEKHLGDNTTIVTHNSDHCIDDTHKPYLQNPKIKKWFCQNRYINHPKLHSLPIGLANGQWPHGNQELLSKIKNENNVKEFLVYKNFNIGTNLSKRNICEQITTKNSIPMSPNTSIENYWRNIAKSYFVISPHGNGVDCHRIWECLILQTVPIVQYHECFSQFTHLPILFINDWNDVTIDFLKNNINIFAKFADVSNFLNINFWKEKICSD